jgi:hypothetical protein
MLNPCMSIIYASPSDGNCLSLYSLGTNRTESTVSTIGCSLVGITTREQSSTLAKAVVFHIKSLYLTLNSNSTLSEGLAGNAW